MVKVRAFYFSEKNENYILGVLDFANKNFKEDVYYRKREVREELEKAGLKMSFSALDRIIKLIQKIQSRRNKIVIEMENKVFARQQ